VAAGASTRGGRRDSAQLVPGALPGEKASPLLAGQLGHVPTDGLPTWVPLGAHCASYGRAAATLTAAEPARCGFRRRIMAAAAMLAVAGLGRMRGASPGLAGMAGCW
jgi:hypothetical protein